MPLYTPRGNIVIHVQNAITMAQIVSGILDFLKRYENMFTFSHVAFDSKGNTRKSKFS